MFTNALTRAKNVTMIATFEPALPTMVMEFFGIGNARALQRGESSIQDWVK
ncbi:hypothetical protein [Caballeronia sp. DA-9]|uniref:hypothetical protein n=1 Tax=Caballeronia sp. DA-9 TaxID=3436237 RepID=UPI003F67B427